MILLAACAFHVPPPLLGAPVSVPLVAHADDPARPYTTLNGATWFVDTGATRTTCDDGLVDDLGLRSVPVMARSRGAVGSVAVRRVVLRDVTVAGWTFSRVPCAVRDLDTTSSLPDGVAGVLGANVFRHFTVALGHGEWSLTKERLEHGAPLRREHGVGPRLLARLDIDGATVHAIVDTGADRTYLPLNSGEELRRWTGTRQGTGPGGAKEVEVVQRRVGEAHAGDLPLPIDAYFEWPTRPGLLGMDAFREGVVVDFPGRRLWISP